MAIDEQRDERKAALQPSDEVSAGVRAEASRLTGFLLVGGICTLLNLGIVALLTHGQLLPYVVASIIAWETTILLNIVLNDRFTFRTLAAGAGPWPLRLARFHGAFLFGAALAIALGVALHSGLGLPPVVAQAISVAVATLVNFASVRLWAYRSRRHEQAS